MLTDLGHKSGVNTMGGWLEQLWSGGMLALPAPHGSSADGIAAFADTHQ